VLHEFDIYPGRANSIKLALTSNGADLPDHTAILRLGVYVGATLFDSQTQPSLFDLTNPDYVEIKLGAASPELPAGRHSCLLVVYDGDEYAGGWIWPQKFIVNVQSEPS
jgi:hypothetical protein